MVTPEVRLSKARDDLENHRALMIEHWGESYEQHPKYAAVVQEIAHKARYPLYALCDYIGL